ncbi:MAG: exopolyphosphatase [Psychroflexus sp.]|nr:exopolyphosphatase [Psychroflexus sp.]MDN6310935.1 exopolyphosphatase [Psychroflexus sp.]
MLSIKKYAAIDVGSNAVRLLIATITDFENKQTNFKKTSLVRVPIRLGQDVFTKGYISDHNFKRMLSAIDAFKDLMECHGVEKYRACATSAMRDAENGELLTRDIQDKTGISIDIIDGKDEAAIIAATDLFSLVDDHQTYLYVDVGGGSTEFTLFSKGETVASKSFKLGTVRLLNTNAPQEIWDAAKNWILTHTKAYDQIQMIGSGGNINNIFKSSGKKPGKTLSYLYLTSYYQLLKSLTYEERIAQLNLNEDRADVIIPAAEIYLSAMKWSKARSIHVPKIGLSDGIIKSLYNNQEVAASGNS